MNLIHFYLNTYVPTQNPTSHPILWHLDYDECQESTACNLKKTTCHNIPGSYECICKGGYIRVDYESEFPKKEDCIIAKEEIIPNYCADNPCGNNAICTNSENFATCKCESGYIGKPYDKTEGCKVLPPDMVLLVSGQINIPITFQVSLNYDYSDQTKMAKEDTAVMLDRILRAVNGYVALSAKVSNITYVTLVILAFFIPIT